MERAIQHAVIAANCRATAASDPTAAKGLLKCADDHSRRAADMVALALTDHAMGE